MGAFIYFGWRGGALLLLGLEEGARIFFFFFFFTNGYGCVCCCIIWSQKLAFHYITMGPFFFVSIGLKHKDSFGKSVNLSKIFFAEILAF